MQKAFTPFLRRYAFLATLTLCATSLWAQTEDDARQAALQFMQQNGFKTLDLKVERLTPQTAPSRVKSQHGTSSSGESTSSNVYAFNADGGGFALVCTGNGHTVVAGYSSTGSLSASNLPEPMEAWLKDYQEVLASTEKSEVNLDTDEPHWEGSTITPVAPLITTKWGQGEPFNNQCPGTSKQRSVAGCAPVALAQLLHYFHLNRKGGGSLSYSHLDSETEYNIDYSTTTYDWNQMLDTYEEGKYTQEQAQAVAKLMLECGIACKANYGYTGTSAKIPFVALNKYYNFECQNVIRSSSIYNSYTVRTSSFYVTTEKWMKMIQEELANGRPIIYTAGDQEQTAGGVSMGNDIIHTFIIDGIDDKNYVHVNWGWAGQADGYYDVAVLNPGVVKFNNVKGFRRSHSMIVGIQPREENFQEKVYQAFVPCIYSSDDNPWIQHASKKDLADELNNPSMKPRYETGKCNFYLTSNADEEKNFRVSLALVRNGKIVYDFHNGSSYSLRLEGPTISICNLKGSFGTIPKVDDGEYELRIIYYENGQRKITPMPLQYVSKVKIQNNATKMSFINVANDDVVNMLSVEDVNPASEIYAGTKFYLNVKTRGYYNGNYKKFKLNFRNVETGKVYGYYQGSGSQNELSYDFYYNDYTQSKIFPFFPKNKTNGFSMPAGRYKVEVNDKCSFAKVVGDLYIDVKEKPDYPVLDGFSLAYMNSWIIDDNKRDSYAALGHVPKSNGPVWQKATCHFSYANKTEEPVTLRLYLVNINTGEELLIHQQENWTPGQEVILNRSFYPLQGLFEFKCRYVTPDGEREGLMPVSYYDKISYEHWAYRYEMGKTESYYDNYLCQFATASSHRIDAQHVGISLSLKPIMWSANAKASVKLLLLNKQTGDLSIVAKHGIEMVENGETTIDFTAPLASGTEYEGWVLCNKWGDNISSENYYVINRDKEFARFTIRKDGSLVGINQVQAPSKQTFSEGEKVKVYDADGRLLLDTTFSSNLWQNLDRTLPHGMYIIKSASRSVKLRK